MPVLRPHRVGETVPRRTTLERVGKGYLLRAALTDGEVIVLLRREVGGELRGGGLRTDGDIAAVRFDAQGKRVATFAAHGANVRMR